MLNIFFSLLRVMYSILYLIYFAKDIEHSVGYGKLNDFYIN